jgi:apolipoprotein N-acyltransferase
MAGTGVALALAYPRPDWEGLAWVALAPVVLTAVSRPPRAAFGWGWLSGTVFFLVLLRWLDFTFRVYSAIPWPLTWLPTLTLAAYCGLYVGLFAAALAWIARRRSPTLALATGPFLWVVGEWIRGHLMGGFPWGNLGYSQYLRLPVIQIAELGGVYAVSLLVVAVNVALAACLILSWGRAVTGLALAGVLVAGTLLFGAGRLREAPPPGELAIAVMQPAIEQPLKWEPRQAAMTLDIYLTLTRRAGAERPGLMVWPETASPTVFRRDQGLLAAVTQLSATFSMPILVGSVDVDDTRSPERYRNTAFLVTDRGIVGRYDKMQLVPFGEYVPLSGVIGFVRGWAEFIAELEPGTRPVVFSGPPAPFGVVICYEGIFPGLFREFVRKGARFMVNMTNDAWFGRTSGPLQHLAMYSLRAVEHRTAIVRSANTGISAFIAPSGRIGQRMELFERGIMLDRVPLRTRETLYTRLGDWLVGLATAVSALALATTLRPRRA